MCADTIDFGPKLPKHGLLQGQSIYDLGTWTSKVLVLLRVPIRVSRRGGGFVGGFEMVSSGD